MQNLLNTIDFNDPKIIERLESKKILEALKNAFNGLNDGSTVQPSTVATFYSNKTDDCLFFPGLVENLDLIGVKVSPYTKSRADSGLNPVTAYTMVLQASTGEFLGVIESNHLTNLRTAGTSALGFDYIFDTSKTKDSNLLIVGAGKVGLEHLRIFNDLYSWKNVEIYSPSLSDPTSQRTKDANEYIKLNNLQNIQFSTDLKTSVQNSDVLVCAAGGTSIIDFDWLNTNHTFISVSTMGTTARDIDHSAIDKMNIFVDYKETIFTKAGDLQDAQKNGWDPKEIVADLPDLIATKNLDTIKELDGIKFFRSTGITLEDLAIAKLIL